MGKHTLLVMYNRHLFMSNAYQGDIIGKELEIERHKMKNQKLFFTLKRHELTDTTNRGSFGLGLLDQSYVWYETTKTDTIFAGRLAKSALEIWFEVDERKVIHTRSVYTFYDLLGDLGGLFGMLQLLSQVLLLVFFTLFGNGF